MTQEITLLIGAIDAKIVQEALEKKLARRKKRRKKVLRFFSVAAALVILFLFFAPNMTSAFGSNGQASDAERDLARNIDDILNELNLDELERFLQGFDQSQWGAFGSRNAYQTIRAVLSGDFSFDHGNLFLFVLEAAGLSILGFLPLLLAVLSIAIAMNLLQSMKGKMSSESVSTIISFVGVALVGTLIAIQVMSLTNAARGMVQSLRIQMTVVFPIMLTLMAASGGGASAGVYQPAVAILSSGMMEILVAVVLPLFILANVFTMVGNLSETVRLKKMSSFSMTSCKWVLGTAFFLFMAFLSVQGITASLHDGVSIRTARFAISKYVPIIGGSLSEGFNLIMAGSVLVKNAVGFMAVIMLFVSVLPMVLNLAVFNLTLHLAGAIAEPLGDKRISSILSGIAKNMGILVAVLLGAIFLYFIFLLLVIATGNPAL